MIEWIDAHEGLFWTLFAVSIVTFFTTLLVVPILLVRLPHDYFTYKRRHDVPGRRRHIVGHVALIVAKNLLGGVLLAMGALMLVTPGQGLLTMIVGVVLLDYPGKYRLERWIVSRPSVLRTINWLRQRGGQPPLRLDDVPPSRRPRS